jgi:hypothetical protein
MQSPFEPFWSVNHLHTGKFRLGLQGMVNPSRDSGTSAYNSRIFQ